MDEAVRFAASPPLFWRPSIAECHFAIDHDEGVVEAIRSIDAVKRCRQDLDGRNLPRLVERNNVGG
jgi:hypothetical protein